MMKSSKNDCGTVHVSSQIAKCCHALSNGTNMKSGTGLKKKHTGSSQCNEKGGDGQKLPPQVIPPSICPLPPCQSTETDGGINNGWLLLLLCVLALSWLCFSSLTVFSFRDAVASFLPSIIIFF